MAKMIGLGAKTEKDEVDLSLFAEENKELQSEIEKLRKEKKKVLDENKALKKALDLQKKEADKTGISEQSESVK
ncbi:hypothetical protein [Anaerotignum sp. MB30-C6]|uniref:hypothetical protein n=1 Tax=Anaerotignum sp. MB30-C6 TaxID=3070814 RepID=UPI0027DCEDE5|nr:hypothetical protein [Anaerotignum sp. MB30-C6]WMI80356.1 hypothetical protein RBQ60_10960 [Anaerotignum sp. MB30-C6]